ncbi:MAG: CinA family protein [Holosporales bacterium]
MMQLFSESLIQQATALLAQLRQRGLTLATAESCTGGLLAALITEIPKASAVYHGGVVCYANSEKIRLGVPATLIEQHGAVSARVAKALAEAICTATGANIGLAVTGIAGPGGATADKPLGLVFMACARAGQSTKVVQEIFPGDRTTIRLAAVARCLNLASIDSEQPPP